MIAMHLESCSEEHGLVEESNDYLARFPNVILVDLNLDEITCIKLASYKEDFEGRLDSSRISSIGVSNEKEYDISKYAVECEDEKCLVF